MYRHLCTLVTIVLLSLVALTTTAGPTDSYNMRRGMEAMKQGDGDEALKYFYQETVDNPKNGYAAFYVAYICHQQKTGNRVGAFRFAKKASELLPVNEKEMRAVSLLIMQKIYKIADDSVNVAKLNEQIKRISPDMAQANIEQKFTIDDLPKLMKMAQGDAPGFILQAIIDVADSTNYRVVLDSLDNHIAQDHKNHLWALMASDIASHQRLYRESFEYVKKALAIHPDAGLYASLAETALNHFSNAELAEECIQRALALDTTDVRTYLSMENLYMETGRYTEALEAAEKALHLDPTYSGIYYLRAVVYRARHEWEEAADEFLKSMLADPNQFDRYFSMAEMYRQAGDTARQQECIRTGKRMVEAYGKELSKEDYIVLGDSAKALELCYAEKIEKPSANQEYNLACAFARLNETAPALEHLRKAVNYGFLNLYHIAWDDDLNSLRELPEFQEILNSCKDKIESYKDITL